MDKTTKIDDMEFSVRTSNLLARAPAIRTFGDLLGFSEQQLLARPGMGHKALREIKLLLAEMGCSLRGSTEPLKCLVAGCPNHSDQGTFVNGLCYPCYHFIATGEGDLAGSSRVYRNAIELFVKRLGKLLIDQLWGEIHRS